MAVLLSTTFEPDHKQPRAVHRAVHSASVSLELMTTSQDDEW